MTTDAQRLGASAAALRAVLLDPSDLSGPRAPDAPLERAERLMGGEFVLWHAGKDATLLLQPLLQRKLPGAHVRAIERAIEDPTVRSIRRAEAVLRIDVPSAVEAECLRVADLLPFHRAHFGCPVAAAECSAAALDYAVMHIEAGDFQRGFLAFRAACLYASDVQADATHISYVGGPIYTRLAAYDQRATVWLRAWTVAAAAEQMIRDEDDILRGGAGQQVGVEGLTLDEVFTAAKVKAVLAASKPAVAPSPPGLVVFPRLDHLPKPTQSQQDRADSPRALVEHIAEEALPLVAAPDPAAFAAALRARFPWAEDAILAFAGDLVGAPFARFRPRILVGPPGCGKTAFARAVIEAAGLHLTVYSAAGQLDGGSFGGTSRQWGTWRLSTSAQAIVRAQQASVGIVVDEVEKAGTSRRWGRLDETLLPCLESHTARAIHDPALEAPVDLSAVSYILTANSLDGLVSPLRDRAPALEWPAPRAEDLPIVAGGILDDLRRERGLDATWAPDLDPEELDAIPWAGGSMRPLRRMVEAVLAGRDAYARRLPN